MPLSTFEHRSRGADPAIAAAGWTDDLVRIEEAPGRITVEDGRTTRSVASVQYLLRIRAGMATQPLSAALLEIKASHLPPDHGLNDENLRTATRRLHVPFAISTNGHQWVMFSEASGFDHRSRPMSEFPKPAQLREWFERATGVGLVGAEAGALVSHGGGDGTRRPHEDAAARAILMQLARREPRALAVLSAGTRPVAVARLVIRRLADAGLLLRGIVLTDPVRVPRYREILGDDPRLQIITPAGAVTLDRPPTHIFIDECVSAHWAHWTGIVANAGPAALVGFTDAPLHEPLPDGDPYSTIAADVLKTFGTPVFAYTFTDATDAGWVSPLELVRRDFGTGRPGTPLDDAFQQLCLAGGPEQRTLVVSAAPEETAALFEARYTAWCDKFHTTPIAPYTAAGGPIVVVPPAEVVRHALPDVQTIIVLDDLPSLQLQRVVTRSASSDVETAKSLLRVLDYASATRHLSEAIRTLYPPTPAPVPAPALPPLTQSTPLDGAEIRQTPIGRYVAFAGPAGERRIGTDELGDQIARAVVAQVRDRTALRTAWLTLATRKALLRALPEEGRAPIYYRAVGGREDAELYDVLAELGWGMRARSRESRAEAFGWRQADWLNTMPVEVGNVIKSLLRQFVMHGTERLDDIDVLQLPDVEVAGGMRALRKGGAPIEMLREIRERLFSV